MGNASAKHCRDGQRYEAAITRLVFSAAVDSDAKYIFRLNRAYIIL